MLILKLDKINFVSFKNKMTILENVHKKLFFLILFILITSFYFLPKINKTFMETNFNFLNELEDDPFRRKPSIDLARKELNWQPKIIFKEGLKITREYFREKLNL